MTSSAPAQSQYTVDDPDHGWKPNNRPQSTLAQNFMSELDDLFRLDGGIDMLDKNVHQKKQVVSSHSQELEALEARLRETEERLKLAKSSPPRRKDSQRRTPTQGSFPNNDKASPMASRQKENISGAPLPETPSSDRSAEYVFVDRPPTAKSNGGEKI
ncbi:hypothetical protein DM02DRAFT_636158 [Periconia macrospinosa]|uniref:Uncharacterized protein n=1 Tax=Periconia macrospinosa TaxID=97972 RepID=A0A2V1D280_9PLEO|nr:hypothetical protein DM02DRAFT_636158 [Periconia macrospinosa]